MHTRINAECEICKLDDLPLSFRKIIKSDGKKRSCRMQFCTSVSHETEKVRADSVQLLAQRVFFTSATTHTRAHTYTICIDFERYFDRDLRIRRCLSDETLHFKGKVASIDVQSLLIQFLSCLNFITFRFLSTFVRPV